MLIYGSNEFNVENYKDYKNRTVKKHIDKVVNQLRQIKDCSLKQDDKNKLKLEMYKLINDSFFS